MSRAAGTVRRMQMIGDRPGQRLGAGAAALWLLAVLVFDVAIRAPGAVLAPLYAVAPLIACAVLPGAAVTGFAVGAVALAVASGFINDVAGTMQQTIRLLDVVLVSAAAIVVAVVRVRREQHLARVVRIADIAQRAILPVLPSRVGPVAVGARYLSAAEDALVGGDLYDYFHSSRHTCFVVGDVRGKGVGAVEQAARVIRAFRQSAAGSEDLAVIALEMSAYLVPFLDEEEFVTAALVQVITDTHVTLVSCGHPPPLLIRGSQSTSLLPPPGLPLGLGAFYESRTLPWAPGDRLLLYTDGLSEARNGAGAFLPLAPLAPELSTASIEDALDGLLAAVRRHVSNGLFTDDLAVLLLENLGSVEPPTARLGGEQTSDAHLDSIGAVADLGGARRGVGTQIDP